MFLPIIDVLNISVHLFKFQQLTEYVIGNGKLCKRLRLRIHDTTLASLLANRRYIWPCILLGVKFILNICYVVILY